MFRNKKILFGLIFALFLVAPLFSYANTFDCEWTGSNCQIDQSRYSCAPGEGSFSQHQQICQNESESSCNDLKSISCSSSANNIIRNRNLGLNIDYPPIPAPVEGGTFDLNCFEGGDRNKCDSDYIFELTIGNMLIFIFVLSLWISGTIAFVSLIFAGFAFITGGASPQNRLLAKHRLEYVLWGIGILFLSVLMLNVINPDITQLNITEQGSRTGGGGGINTNPNEGNLEVDYPRIPVPGGEFDLNKAVELGQVEPGTIFGFIYAVSIWLAGTIAFVSLVYAGFQFIVSGANPHMRYKAKEQLKGVVYGVAILLFGFIMLTTANPDVEFLGITGQAPVPPQSAEPPGSGEGGGSGTDRGTYSCQWNGSSCEVSANNCTQGHTPQCNELNVEGEATNADREEACNSIQNDPCTQEFSEGGGSGGGGGGGGAF